MSIYLPLSFLRKVWLLYRGFTYLVVEDESYLNETWRLTSSWRMNTVKVFGEMMSSKGLDYTCHGEPFLRLVVFIFG